MNLPNYLSLFRLCLVPVFVLVYFSGARHANLFAALVFAIAAFSDFLDGHIARKYGLTTTLGKILDPLGDKLMTFAVLICITIDQVIPLWALLVFFTKELLMALGGLVLYKRISDMPPSNYFGKCSTVVFFAVCVILMIFTGIPPVWATVMISIAIAVMIVAFISYLLSFIAILRGRKEEG